MPAPHDAESRLEGAPDRRVAPVGLVRCSASGTATSVHVRPSWCSPWQTASDNGASGSMDMRDLVALARTEFA